MPTQSIRLTEYSHGAGCGCKIAPAVLTRILAGVQQPFVDPRVLVGNGARDDAAVYALDEERVSHYFEASLSEQFDAVVHLDRTQAIEPLP